jgi:adenine/guanine phosphoribosyltransferase-like PRPP-binding protein
LSSVVYSSYVLAFVGLGLTFWGALLLYIKSTKYVKLELFNAASSSGLYNIERILVTTKTDLRGIYLPPKNLQDNTSSLVFIPTVPNQPLPTSVETNPQKLNSKNSIGFFLTPPGLALSKLLEKELKKPFAETSLEDLQTQLPKLFDELQITKHLTIQPQDNLITITITNHVFEDLCKETAKLELTHKKVGCPLSSALACAFAKATGKPIVIAREETGPDETTTIKYKVLED